MDNKTEKVLWGAVAVTVVVALLFIGFMARGDYEDRFGSQPDIVIVGVNASGEMVQSDILPLTEDTRIVFPASEEVTEYHLTYAH